VGSPTTSAVALGGVVAGQVLRALEADGQWEITGLDPEVPFRIAGRFPLRDGVKVDVEAQYGVSQGLGDQGELVQFVSGRSDRVNITVELHDTTPVVPDVSVSISDLSIGLDVTRDDVRSELEQLEALCRKHPRLGRPPKCRFSFGTEWGRDVFVLSASSQVKRVDRSTGRLAEVYVRLSMVEAVDTYLEETDPGAPEAESTEVVVQDGWTHELVAALELGDPDLGVYLRQRDTDHYAGILASGDRVLVLDRDHTSMRGPEFLAPVFTDDGTGDYTSRMLEHIAARSGSKVVPS